MKKFLSLVLALVMTMSLVTVSAGAKDFTDASKIAYDEAVDVMSAVKVIDGYTDGTFNPTATLTRGAAAKIICNLILGPTTASALSASSAPFKDVPVSNTFAGYITYCAQEKIINGYPDGTFRPDKNVTRAELMAMINRATGRAPKSADAFLPGMKTWIDNTADKWYYLDVQEATNSHSYTVKGSETWTALTSDPNWSLYE